MSRKDEMKKEYDFSKGRRGAVVPQRGKTRITIYLDNDILAWFKNEAEREGTAYQPAINQALRSHIRQSRKSLEEIVRDTVRKELRVLRKAV